MFKPFVLSLEPSCFSAPTVNALSTNLDLNVADKNVADVVNPAEAKVSLGSRGLGALNKGKSDLKVSAVNKITVTRDRASNTLAEVSSSVEYLLNRLHREVSVTTINDLEEGNLGVTSKINILCSVSYELH